MQSETPKLSTVETLRPLLDQLNSRRGRGTVGAIELCLDGTGRFEQIPQGCKPQWRRFHLGKSASPDNVCVHALGAQITSGYPPGTAGAAFNSLLPQWPAYDVIFHELWRDTEGGWSVNDSWKVERGCDRETAIGRLCGRWAIFKLNYLPQARVKDITDASCDSEGDCLLEVDCTAFATVRKGEL